MYVISTSEAEHIGKKLEQKGINVIFTGRNKEGENFFPDGEIYTRIPHIEKLSGEKVVVLHSGMPSPNKGLIGLFNVLEILNNPVRSEKTGPKEYKYRRLKGPESVEVFFLYFPYSMQDKVFETGEANMAEALVKKLVNYYNVSGIYVVDSHFSNSEWIKNYPVINISSESLIASAMKNDGLAGIVKVAPDIGACARLKIDGMKKERKDSFTVEMQASDNLKDTVSGKIAAVWDDLIETGGTMVRAKDKLLEMGARKVVAAATHGVLAKGVKRVNNAYPKLYLTNTIDSEYANVDVTELVADVIISEGKKQ